MKTSHPPLWKDYLSLTKPRLSFMVIVTAGCGWLLARSTLFTARTFEEGFTRVETILGHSLQTSGAALTPLAAFFFLLGTSLIVGAANAINCVLEKDVDGFMERTRDRPLVQGRISPDAALVFGLGLAAIATLSLWLSSNPLTAALGLLGFLSYVGIYTPLKRRSMGALFAGAVPGAIPPMMGWTAVTGRLELGAWILFGILFFWQLPHFIAISIYRQHEYDRAGLKTVPGTLGANAASQHMLIYTALLVGVSLLPYPLGLAGAHYLLMALALGILFTGLCLAGILKIKDLNWARAVFFGSLAYLPLVLGTWVFERTLRSNG